MGGEGGGERREAREGSAIVETGSEVALEGRRGFVEGWSCGCYFDLKRGRRFFRERLSSLYGDGEREGSGVQGRLEGGSKVGGDKEL